MSVVVVTPPSALVSLALAKQHLRVDTVTDDDLISFYIATAQSMIDGPGGWLGRCIGVQALEYRLDDFPKPSVGYSAQSLFSGSAPGYGSGWAPLRIGLPYPPLISVTSVTYLDAAGQQQTLPPENYVASDDGLEASFGMSFPPTRCGPNAVRIAYEAGYASTPPAVAAAMLLMVGDLYGNRGTVETGVRAAAVTIPMSTTVENLLSPYRVIG